MNAQDQDTFSLELIISTKNGGDRLAHCLESILQCDRNQPFYVHVVDNNSDDGISMGILQEFVRSFGEYARLSKEFKKGNSAGRNKALSSLRGDYAIFIDDDCYIAFDFMRQWRAVLAGGGVDFGGGSILEFNPEHSSLGCFSAPSKIPVEPRNFVKRGFVQGSNMFFSAACLRDIGFFDERFGAGTAYAGEEWDLALAASRAGYAGGYFPEPTVYHDHGRRGDEASERLLFYDYGAGAVYAKQLVEHHDMKALKVMYADVRRCKWRRRKLALFSGFMRFLWKRGRI